MKEFKRGSFVASAALILALGMPAIGSAALEGSSAGQYEVNVTFSDLDLSQDAGVSALYKRLRTAAYRACGSRSVAELGSIERASANRQCFDSFLSRAVGQIGNDKLARMHTG